MTVERGVAGEAIEARPQERRAGQQDVVRRLGANEVQHLGRVRIGAVEMRMARADVAHQRRRDLREGAYRLFQFLVPQPHLHAIGGSRQQEVGDVGQPAVAPQTAQDLELVGDRPAHDVDERERRQQGLQDAAQEVRLGEVGRGQDQEREHAD